MRKTLISALIASAFATAAVAQPASPGAAFTQALDQYCSEWLKAENPGANGDIQARALRSGWTKLNISNPQIRGQRAVAAWGQIDLTLDTGLDNDTRACTINMALDAGSLSWNQAYAVLDAWATKNKPTATKTDDQRLTRGEKRTTWVVDGQRVITLGEPEPRAALPRITTMVTIRR